METDIVIGTAQAGQIPALATLIGELFSIEPDFKIDLAKQISGLTLLLAVPERALVLCAQTTLGQVVGLVTMQLVVSTSEGGLSAWLEDLYVLKDFRKQGIAQSLIERAIDWAHGKGATRIQLLADKENTHALEFYQRRNWRWSRLVALVMRPEKLLTR
jgi:GNAT superfamily N-acetyltransferase